MHELIGVQQFICSTEISFADGNISDQKQLRPCDDFANKCEGVASRQAMKSTKSEQEVNTSIGSENDACIVCMERPLDAVLLECGHSGLCVECATVLWDQARRCPLCRRGFAAIMRIVARETRMVCISCLTADGQQAFLGSNV
jgi:hypothetical protein